MPPRYAAERRRQMSRAPSDAADDAEREPPMRRFSGDAPLMPLPTAPPAMRDAAAYVMRAAMLLRPRADTLMLPPMMILLRRRAPPPRYA